MYLFFVTHPVIPPPPPPRSRTAALDHQTPPPPPPLAMFLDFLHVDQRVFDTETLGDNGALCLKAV